MSYTIDKCRTACQEENKLNLVHWNVSKTIHISYREHCGNFNVNSNYQVYNFLHCVYFDPQGSVRSYFSVALLASHGIHLFFCPSTLGGAPGSVLLTQAPRVNSISNSVPDIHRTPQPLSFLMAPSSCVHFYNNHFHTAGTKREILVGPPNPMRRSYYSNVNMKMNVLL